MPTNQSRPWGLHLLTFICALCVASSGVFWALGTLGASEGRGLKALPISEAFASEAQTLARSLGGGAISTAEPARPPETQLQLLGVVSGPVGKGLALLVVGNAPPKAYTVGQELGDGQVLQAVSARGAKIGNTLKGKTTVELSLPKASGT